MTPADRLAVIAECAEALDASGDMYIERGAEWLRQRFLLRPSSSADPIANLRRAVREIWTEVGAVSERSDLTNTPYSASLTRVRQLREVLAHYKADRGLLLSAAVRHATGLGFHFGEVAHLISVYDSGLATLKEADPE